MNKNKELVILPNYLDGVDDNTIHLWRQWHALSVKIDNHPERFYSIVSQHTGATKVMDCKGAIGLVKKWARDFGASDADLIELERITREMQDMKTRKGHLNIQWTKKVFGAKKRGSLENTMLDVRQNELIDLFSKFYSISEIKKIIVDKWNLSISHDTVKAFYIDHKEKIDKLKADYLLSGKELRFATDMGRLEVLSRLAWEMEHKFDKNKSLEVSKELRAIIEQIRKEVKGDEIRLTVEGKIDINATIQANQTLHEALQKLPINMIIIGLTAAKQGINPAQLMGSLANSFYSQYNGFNKLADTKEMQLPGQYIKSYNWDEIRQKNEGQVIEVETIEEAEVIEREQDRVAAVTNKRKMIELLESYKEQIK